MDLLIQILLFFILGVLLYYLDARILSGLYRWWYGMTNKEGLAEGVSRGFVNQRSVGVRVGWAIAITVLIGLVTLTSKSFWEDTLLVVQTLLALFVGLTIGLLAAPYILSFLPGKVESAVDYMDKVESGEKDVKADLKNVAGKATKNIAGMAAGGSEKIREVASEVKKEVFEAADDARDKIKDMGDPKKRKEERKEENKDEGKDEDGDWRSGVKDFLDK